MECLIEKITSKIKVDTKTSCWNWQGHKKNNGYGQIGYKYKDCYVHRIMWLIVYGFMPTECVLHKCDNPSCCNPAHLFLGSQQDNIEDMVKKHRRKGIKSGKNKLTEADVLSIKKRLAAKESCRKIAADFNVTERCISHIKCGNTWTHI